MLNEIIRKTTSNPIISGVRGDNIYMIYVFVCGCELPSNYKGMFTIKIKCGRHSLDTLIEKVEKTRDWSDIKFLENF